MARLPSLRKLTTYAALGVVGGYWYFSDPRASAYRYVVLPLARSAYPDGEEAHRASVQLMKHPWLNPRLPAHWLELADPQGLLRTELFTKSKNPRVRRLILATPIGVAAGLDKNAEAVDTLLQYGFSWVEVGSVTPEPQDGNPKPRVFRLPEDKAIVNRYGFNSDGHAVVAARLQTRLVKKLQGEVVFAEQQNASTGAEHLSQGRLQGSELGKGRVLAVNLGKNKTGDEIQDYVKGVQTFGGLADALVVNVSSPNTPGLRDLQAGGKLGELLTRLVSERDALPYTELPPLLVKIAPDVSSNQIEAIAAAVKSSNIDGVIVGNTTIGRPGSLKSEPSLVNQNGGLSGPPVKPMELQALRTLRNAVGPDVTIVGCGGIDSADDALEYAHAGADFVQLYTSFAFDGPEKPASLAEDLVKILDGKSWSSARSN